MSDTAMILMNFASGTSQNPQSAPMPMLMRSIGNWDAMAMGTAFIVDTQQSGAGGKFYSTNWFMGSVQHAIGERATFQADVMLSLEPATITDRRYPLLFQTGETAFGIPLVDAQHPHNFVMALGFHYMRQIAEDLKADLYVAPVGDPALGPVAFPHRASASEIPQAPISHHLQDSTHIAYDVVTAGLNWNKFRAEASGFHGAEPGENRWTIGYGAIDSWSTRLWFFPTANWAAQISMGRLTKPEALEPGDQVRAAASVSYSRYGWSSSFIWGRTHNTASQRDLNSWLGESVLPIRRRNFLTGRIEVVDKDELHIPGIYRIGAYTFGYTRDIGVFANLETGLGANFTAYSLPDTLRPLYGDHPVGANIFLRLRIRRGA
jgi:hypothetical protein